MKSWEILAHVAPHASQRHFGPRMIHLPKKTLIQAQHSLLLISAPRTQQLAYLPKHDGDVGGKTVLLEDMRTITLALQL